MARSIRSYQREIRNLKELIEQMQWVCPTYNGADSCAGCGGMRHLGCYPDCEVANITKDYGTPEENNPTFGERYARFLGVVDGPGTDNAL